MNLMKTQIFLKKIHNAFEEENDIISFSMQKDGFLVL